MALTASPTLAEQYYGNLSLGYNVLNGQAGSESDDGALLGLTGGYRLDDKTALEISLMTSRHDDEALKPGDHTIKLTALNCGPDFSWPLSSFKVHSGLGLGVYYVDYRFRPETLPLPPLSDDDYEAGLYAQAGLEFKLSTKTSLSFWLKYHWIPDNEVIRGDILSLGLSLGWF